MKVRVKANAKLNLTLSVTGKNERYHSLDTVVTTISLYDEIILKPRKDGEINVGFFGKYADKRINPEKSNAYKAVALVKERYNITGADVKIKCNIPTASGLGGSSADTSGVLNALKKAYKINDGLKPLADELGSDTGYLLQGGSARLKGRGEIVEEIGLDNKFYAVLVFNDRGVETGECFKRYDAMQTENKDVSVDEFVKAFKSGDTETALKLAVNDLYLPAVSLCPEIKDNLQAVINCNPDFYLMSGSGPTVYGLFKTYKRAKLAERLLKKQGLKAVTVKN